MKERTKRFMIVAIIMVQFIFAGMLLIVYGYRNESVGRIRAEHMLTFIEHIDPVYHSRLTAEETTEYREKFDAYFGVSTSGRYVNWGIVLVLLSMAGGVPMLYVVALQGHGVEQDEVAEETQDKEPQEIESEPEPGNETMLQPSTADDDDDSDEF